MCDYVLYVSISLLILEELIVLSMTSKYEIQD